MRLLLTLLSAVFFAAALVVAAMAVRTPAWKPVEDGGGLLPHRGPRTAPPPAARGTTEPRRDDLTSGGEGEGPAAAAIQHLREEQAAYRTLVAELRRNIASLEEELDQRQQEEAIQRLREEQIAQTEEMERLREELALFQRTMDERNQRQGEGTTVLPQQAREEPPPPRYPLATGTEGSGKIIAVLGGGIFPSGLESPSTELRQAIRRLLPEIVLQGDARIVVEGHSDSMPVKADAKGGYADNKVLSLLRAEGIARMLEEEGIDPGRIAVAAFGDTRPLAPNTTTDGRAENRRVEIRLVPGRGGRAPAGE